MLRRRLTALAITVTALAACGGSDAPAPTVVGDGPTDLACGNEAGTLRTALGVYIDQEGRVAPDEAALVDAGLIRGESDLWDVVDGELVPADPACGDVPTGVPASDIITATEPLTADEVYGAFTPDDVASLGGEACARQMAVLTAAGYAYVDEHGVAPVAVADLAPLAEEPITMWTNDGDRLVAVEGSGCIAPEP